MTKKTTSPSKEEEPVKEEVKKINSIHLIAHWMGLSLKLNADG